MTVITFRENHALHASRGHPERPARLNAVRDALAADPALRNLRRITGAPASRESLERVHPPTYLDRLAAACTSGGGSFDVDTYATPHSLQIASETCGDLLALVDAVCTAEASNGFTISRPPGHHASPERAMGFCLLSTAAIAAKHAQTAHGLRRVLVLDMDVHHGNGTQDALYDDPSVLFVSSHQTGLFPGTGAIDETGVGAGEGFTANLPVPAGTDDAGMLAVYESVLVPLADRFAPELVIVSAGYDAHRLDPLGGLALSVGGMTDLVRVARRIAERHAEGRIVLTLEGGYNPEVLAHSVTSSLRVLLDPDAAPSDPFGPTRQRGPDLTALIEQLRRRHRLG